MSRIHTAEGEIVGGFEGREDEESAESSAQGDALDAAVEHAFAEPRRTLDADFLGGSPASIGMRSRLGSRPSARSRVDSFRSPTRAPAVGFSGHAKMATWEQRLAAGRPENRGRALHPRGTDNGREEKVMARPATGLRERHARSCVRSPQRADDATSRPR